MVPLPQHKQDFEASGNHCSGRILFLRAKLDAGPISGSVSHPPSECRAPRQDSFLRVRDIASVVAEGELLHIRIRQADNHTIASSSKASRISSQFLIPKIFPRNSRCNHLRKYFTRWDLSGILVAFRSQFSIVNSSKEG